MGLYKLFSYNVEVQYMSNLLSRATFFTLATTLLTIILPFIIGHMGRGFWLRSHSFYEQPAVHFSYQYLLVAESDDPSKPIECGETNGKYGNSIKNEEHCAEFQIQEYDVNGDGKNDLLDFKFHLNIPQGRTITSVIIMLILDFKLKMVCPLHMQSLAVIDKDFATPPSGLKYFADLQFYQISHLPCKPNHIHTKYNNSLFNYNKHNKDNAVDYILDNYFLREAYVRYPNNVASKDRIFKIVTTHTKTLYSRSQNGHTDYMQIQVSLRVPEMEIRYTPSLLQELKWAWPQYLSLVVIYYWIFNKIKRFVFNNRLLMAWEVSPWKKHHAESKRH